MISIMKNDIQNKLMNVDNNLFEVYSAFNGFAIYRTKKFLGLRYDGKFQKYFPDEKIINMINYVNKTYNTNLSIIKFEQNCEHISFHLKAIRQNNAKIRISKKMIFF